MLPHHYRAKDRVSWRCSSLDFVWPDGLLASAGTEALIMRPVPSFGLIAPTRGARAHPSRMHPARMTLAYYAVPLT